MSLITYITDQHPGEDDILTPLCGQTLTIKTLAGDTLYQQEAPPSGWTHAQLMHIQPEGIGEGADAYLAQEWVGSTEI